MVCMYCLSPIQSSTMVKTIACWFLLISILEVFKCRGVCVCVAMAVGFG